MAEATIPVKVKHVHHLEIGDEAFWLGIWTLLSVALIALVIVLTQRSLASDELIAKSADPVATACAISFSASVNNQCMALLARKN